jgi:branched-chain amino acid transport system substrate-binding protein
MSRSTWRHGRTMVCAAAVALLAAACSSSTSSSAGNASLAGSGGSTSASGGTIKIGFITQLTGDLAELGASELKGVTARIDAQNAAGGVDGKKLQLITVDDGSSTSQALSAAQVLVSKGVFGIIANQNNDGAIEPYLRGLGVPVATAISSTACGVPGNGNIFNGTICFGATPRLSSTIGDFLKQQGATVVGTAAYSVSEASVAAAQGTVKGSAAAGLSVKYQNVNVQLSGENYTADGIAMARAGINAWAPALIPSANLAMYEAALASGAKIKVLMMGSEAPSMFTGKAAQQLSGAYFTTSFVPAVADTPATQAYTAALAKYSGVPESDVLGQNDWNTEDAWLSADVFIKGLQLAGANPTRAAFIKNLRAVTDYTAGGLEIKPVNISLGNYGSVYAGGQNNCAYFIQYIDNTIKLVPGGPVCGTVIK